MEHFLFRSLHGPINKEPLPDSHRERLNIY
jgi:hypothetical protein